MRIPQSTLDEINARTDLVQLIGSCVKLKSSNGGRNFMGCCPFHADQSPSFSVKPSKGSYNCFGCGAHGNAINFMMEYEGVSFLEAVTSLADDAGVELPKPENAPQFDRDTAILLRKLHQADALYRQELLDSPLAIGYLKGRGVDSATACKYGLGYAPPSGMMMATGLIEYPDDPQFLARAGLVYDQHSDKPGRDRFLNRIVFPIRNARGNVVGFSGRYIGDRDGPPKYLNSPESELFKKRQLVYGLYEALQSAPRHDHIYVVEGQMDVIACGKLGYPTVASLGTAFTAEQATTLFRYTNELVFCMDGDKAGMEATKRIVRNIAPVMTAGRAAKFVQVPGGLDPDEFISERSPEAFDSLVDQAESYSDAILRVAAGGNTLETPEGRSKIADEMVALVAAMPDSSLRQAIIKDMADSLNLHYPQLIGLVSVTERKLADRSGGQPEKMAPSNSLLAAQVRMDPVATLIYITTNFPTTAVYIESQVQEEAFFLPRGSLLRTVTDACIENQGSSIEELAILAPEYDQAWLKESAVSQPFGSLRIDKDARQIKGIIDNATNWLEKHLELARQFRPPAPPADTPADHQAKTSAPSAGAM